MAPGARSEFGAPMFELEVFLNSMYCIEESTGDIVRTSFVALRVVPPASLRPWPQQIDV